MWTTLYIGHSTCLITLAFVMLLFAPAADSVSISLPCCLRSSKIKKPKTIVKCFEQKDRYDCRHHAFLIMTETTMICVSPTTKWLMELIKTGKLKCPPNISYKHRFKFLDED